jgi:hypothetical protein
VSSTKDKTKILDEVSEITGLNRTYLLHLLANKTTSVFYEGKRLTLKAAPLQKTAEKSSG